MLFRSHATDIIAENPHSSFSLIAITYMINKLKHDILDSSKLLTSIKLLKTMIYKRFMQAFYTTTTCIAHFLVQPNTNKFILNTLQTNISEAREYFVQKKTESSTQDTYKNLELTTKTAARQEYSIGISEAQEYSDRKSTRLNSSHSGESRMPSSA